MKIAIVSDTHLSVRNDLQVFLDNHDEFFGNVFFPELKRRGINQIYHLGDFFDKRQYVSVKSMNSVRKFIRLLDEYSCTMDLIVGNHDILYRNTLEYNSPKHMFASTDRITVHEEPVELGPVLMVPWITKENYQSTMDVINRTLAEYCFGHFEISGFELHKGQTHAGGLEPSIFRKFKRVLSGHFHTRSANGNINYIGSPFEISWSDYNDPRGWHVFDTDTGELEFIRYDKPLFFKVEYADGDTIWKPYRPDSLTGKFVKVIVKTKDSYIKFENFIKELHSENPSDVQVYENNTHELADVLTEDAALSNIDIITEKVNNSIDNLPEDQKAVLLNYMIELYNESAKMV